MTTMKELEIKKMNVELENKLWQKKNLERDIEKLYQKIQKCQKMPETYFDTILESFEDFPLTHRQYLYLSEKIGSTLIFGECKQATINDLVKSSPEEILEIRGIGKGNLQKIKNWMKEHNIQFIS